MNAIVLAVLVMIGLTLSRVSVVFSLLTAALVGGLYAGMPIQSVIAAFNDGLGSGASVALAYAALGAFAVALSHTGITQRMTHMLVRRVGAGHTSATHSALLKWGMVAGLVAMGCIAETIVPIHIAFIPILVPPLLHVMNSLRLDRRLVACAITFSITVTYMLVPVGFGKIFLNDILIGNINQVGGPLGLSATTSITRAARALLLPMRPVEASTSSGTAPVARMTAANPAAAIMMKPTCAIICMPWVVRLSCSFHFTRPLTESRLKPTRPPNTMELDHSWVSRAATSARTTTAICHGCMGGGSCKCSSPGISRSS